MKSLHRRAVFFAAFSIAALSAAVFPKAAVAEDKLDVLFIGNSYTARHNLAKVVKAMAEAGNSGLTFNPTSVIYGGRTLRDHWRLQSQNYLQLTTLTREQQEASVAALEEAVKDPNDRYAKGALTRHRKLLADLEQQRMKFDVVVLQSYRDDISDGESPYEQYAPKFAALAKANGMRVVLYETSPTIQNLEAIKSPPEPEPTLTKTRKIAALANRIDAKVAPMSLVALRCQQQRPDFTLRFINDAHLNHTMAYLTACSLYAALFDKNPEGLPIDSITDIRYLGKDKTKDRDGNPITRTFSDKDRADLQRIAWESVQEFRALRSGGDLKNR